MSLKSSKKTAKRKCSASNTDLLDVDTMQDTQKLIFRLVKKFGMDLAVLQDDSSGLSHIFCIQIWFDHDLT